MAEDVSVLTAPTPVVHQPITSTKKKSPTVVWKITTPLPGLRKIRKNRRKKTWQPHVLVAESSDNDQVHMISVRRKRQMPRVTLCLWSSFAVGNTGVRQISDVVGVLKSLEGLKSATVSISPARQDWTITIEGSEQDVLDNSVTALLRLGIQDAGENFARNWIEKQATKDEFARGAICVDKRWIGGVAAVLDDEASVYKAIPPVIHQIDVPIILHLENGSWSTLVPASGMDKDELTWEIAKLRLRLAGEQIHSVRISEQRLLRVLRGAI